MPTSGGVPRQKQSQTCAEGTVTFKGRVQSVCKQSLCLHFGIQNIELYSQLFIFSCFYSIPNISKYCNNIQKFSQISCYLYKNTFKNAGNTVDVFGIQNRKNFLTKIFLDDTAKDPNFQLRQKFRTL
jgi:hypothetical protein